MAVKARWPKARPASENDVPAEPTADDPIARLGELMDAEGRLFDRQITCAIRDRSDTCCSACSIAGRDPRLEGLCDIGREQERLITQMRVDELAPPAS